MTEPAVDADDVTDDDYLYFFGEPLEKMAGADADRIWDLLDLEPEMEVLDLGCGHGRIANRLARRGCRVTGLDVSLTFLDRAREDAAACGVTVDYVHDDMRNLAWSGRFDRIVNWANAFGFLDEPDDQRVLTRVAEALKPGGRLIMETANFPRFIRDFRSSSVLEHEGALVIDQGRWDPLTGRSFSTRTVVQDGSMRRSSYITRVYTFPELRGLLRTAGFATVDGYGEDGSTLNADHHRSLAVARL